MVRAVAAWWALALIPAIACAQGNADPMEACYQKPDGAARLACFNQEMQRRHPGAAPAAVAPQPAAATVAPASRAQSADDTVGLQGSALRRALKEEGVREATIKPIVARVVRVLPRPHSELAFVLDNGQTWEQAESMESLDVKLRDSVTIKPGVFGAFFLNTPRNQRVRVHRIL